jgi:glycosyltransferase involved in cell wall biosynthesis
MRALHVCLDGNLPRYGIGIAVVRLADHLARAGVETTLACRARSAPEASVAGVSVLPLEHRTGLLGSARGYLAQLRPALERPQDVVHVHALARAASWLLPPRRRRGASLVVTCHSEEELGESGSASGAATPARARRHRRHVERVLRAADAVVVASRWAESLAIGRGAPRERVHRIGLAPSDDVPAPARPHEGFVVVSLLRFVASKGPHVLLEAFHRAFPDVAEAALVIAGDGPERAACEERARALGLAGRVRFPGWVEGEARRDLLARADVVVAPSMAGETFCLAALDAQAAGVPVVASDHPALLERAEGGAALTVAAGDADALAAALRRVREDPALRDALRRAGRRAAQGSRWDEVALRHRRLYEELRADVQPDSFRADPRGRGAARQGA